MYTTSTLEVLGDINEKDDVSREKIRYKNENKVILIGHDTIDGDIHTNSNRKCW